VLGGAGAVAALAHRLSPAVVAALFPVVVADLGGMSVRVSALAWVIGGVGLVLRVAAMAVALLTADSRLSIGWWRPFRRLLREAASSHAPNLGTDQARRRH
jgi:hypothetical protein